ncbi:hypothetical protein A3840_17930 [Devosia elaeis]|uniref:BioF2-like acetyltransferase domain-containing protein n=1 Tax=Devosia elaeis TaxID=1770058 RepID=A0A178HN93_9HYPH|nr:hypothetical protein A3840_17930 [Devosia elaeis]
MGSMVTIETKVLGTLDEIDAIAPAWRELEARCADPLSYFQSFDWCRNWVAQFSADGNHRPYIVTIWRGERLIALWPRMIVDMAGIRRLETLGAPHSQYCGVLVRRDGTAWPGIAKALLAAVRASRCDVTISRAVPEGSALAKLLADKPVVRGSDNIASMLDLSLFPSSEAYTAQLGKLQKRNRNRRRNHLARLGELHFEVIWPDHAEFGALVRQCTEMKRRWLAETGRFSSGFSMAGYEDFLASLGGNAARLSGACLSVLRAGERVVALELGFIRQRHYYAYIGGFDWDLRELSPGKVQMDLTVNWLIDKGGAGRRYRPGDPGARCRAGLRLAGPAGAADAAGLLWRLRHSLDLDAGARELCRARLCRIQHPLPAALSPAGAAGGLAQLLAVRAGLRARRQPDAGSACHRPGIGPRRR